MSSYYRNKDREGEELRGVRNSVSVVPSVEEILDIIESQKTRKLTRMDCNPVRRKDPTDLMVSSRQKIELGGACSC